jgi:integrase
VAFATVVAPSALAFPALVRRLVHNAQVAADLPRFRPYDLRHTHASLLIDLDAHPKAISERMGHSEIGVTMNVYGHLFQDKQEKLTNDLDALVERTRVSGGTTVSPSRVEAISERP